MGTQIEVLQVYHIVVGCGRGCTFCAEKNDSGTQVFYTHVTPL